ncbi:hypothetical protein SLS62_001765 [Diatrype stigma]|uniref:Protein kinase domain-containing protein n=1 Tax=Diatrype stigma TaxID=117547 RepID=A0AAN9V9T7_9PEZI
MDITTFRTGLPVMLQRYTVGQHLDFEVEDTPDFPKATVLVEVTRLQKPWTLSSGLVVKVLEAPGLHVPYTAFLKSYDRRFAYYLRSSNEIYGWDETKEYACLEYVKNGEAGRFLAKLRDDKTFATFRTVDWLDWSDGQNEAYLTYKLQQSYDAERAIYAALEEYQGVYIPRLLLPVNRNIMPTGVSQPSEGSEVYHIKGLLLQYLEGFKLSEIEDYAPPSSWQEIVDQAIHIVRVLDSKSILNYDVHPNNFLVVPRDDGDYQVFMVDLAHCRLRREDESDREWGRAKCLEDEEGRIGDTMQVMLGSVGFDLTFEHSERYSEFADGYN